MAEPMPPPVEAPRPLEPTLDLLEHNEPLHRRMSHVRASKLQAVATLLMFGCVLVFIGIMLLEGVAWALVALGVLVLVGAVAAYRTLEDEP